MRAIYFVLEYTNKYVQLRQTIGFNIDRQLNELKKIIRLRWTAYGKVSHVFRNLNFFHNSQTFLVLDDLGLSN